MPFKGRGNGLTNSRIYSASVGDGESVWIKHPDFKRPYKRKWNNVKPSEEKFIISDLKALDYFDDEGNFK